MRPHCSRGGAIVELAYESVQCGGVRVSQPRTDPESASQRVMGHRMPAAQGDLRQNEVVSRLGVRGCLSVAATGSKSAAMAGAGLAAGLGLSIVLTLVLSPFLSFMALGTGPFAALFVAAIVLTCSVFGPCGAPEWAQRRRWAFWLGAFSVTAYFCVGAAVSFPQLILFRPL